jgi:exopolyphosphatase/guanosine-5'-triphosphate,3'-diphosphate pyrophosphatase
MKIAIIDCGTNTFTLSLFEVSSSKEFKRSLKDRHYVELAEEGIKHIGPKAFKRGVDAFQAFHDFLKNSPDTKTIAIGTAALRRASNSTEFLAAVEAVSGIRIEIIDGDKEADLIYKGVRLAAPLGSTPSLIMDIGGGSVEFIIADQKRVYWAKSYPVGVAILFKKFHHSDPINATNIKDLNNYLEQTLFELIEQLSSHSIEHLIGASGSFDVLDTMNGAKDEAALFGYISTDAFHAIYQQLVDSDYEERLNTENLSSTRAKLIVMSVLLIKFIHQKIKPPNLVVSDHAMREGLVYELLES